ncbi:MAG: hypothetical protein LUQ59_05020 [Methanothrix sp.]|nr:hypothetical protein [Methanothrix sp.]
MISAPGLAVCSSLNQLSQAHCIPGAELRIDQGQAMQEGPDSPPSPGLALPGILLVVILQVERRQPFAIFLPGPRPGPG